MRQLSAPALLAIAFPALAPGAAAFAAPARALVLPPQIPFSTTLPWQLPERGLEVTTSVTARFADPPPFSEGAAGRRDLSRSSLGTEVSAGLGSRVEGSARFEILDTWGEGGTDGIAAGDLRVEIGYALAGSGGSPTALAGRFTAKVPTASEKGSAGTDEADLGIHFSYGWRSDWGGVFGAAGLELLGNPLRNGSQDDVATYGLGVWWGSPEGWQMTGELEGRAFSRFGNSPSTARAGCRWIARSGRDGSGLAVQILILRGLNGDATRWGLSTGLAILKF